MKKLLLIFLAFGMLFANTPQQALDSYYSSFMLEDIDAFMDTSDTSTSTSEQVSNTRERTTLLWEQYDTDTYSISKLECLEDGDDALCEYKLHAEISGAETFSYDLDHITLLHKVSGEWKVSFAIPLDEYLETREEQEKLAMLDEEQELYSKEPLDGPGQVTFNGEPMQDLSNELDDMLYSCITDEYCVQNDYGNSCTDGKCTDAGFVDVDWSDLVETDERFCETDYDCQVNNWGTDCADGICIYAQQPYTPSQGDECVLAYVLLLPLLLFLRKN